MAVGNVPPQLKDKRLVSLNMASLVAGTKYRGEFEERLRDVLGEIRVRRDGEVVAVVPAVAGEDVQLPGMVDALIRIRDHFMLTGA